MSSPDELRQQLLEMLRRGHAHLSFQEAIAGFPEELHIKRPRHCLWSGWDLLEHLRLAQWDILEFIRNPEHVSPPWPSGYWPNAFSTCTPEAWDRSVAAFLADRRALERIVRNPATDLTAPMKHARDKSILREVLLVIDHNSYHLGQMVLVRRLLGIWPEES